MPARVRDASTRVRAASKPGGVTRPVRCNLLALGLAHGQGAAELEAAAAEDQASKRDADRAARVGAAGADRDPSAEGAGDAEAKDRAPDPAAIAAMATEIREIGRKRDGLAEELAGLDRERAELQAKLMALLGGRGR